MDGGLFTFGPLQHPAGRTEMGEADLAVVEHPLSAGCGKRGRDIDHVNVGECDREFGKRDIGQAEARAMSLHATFR